MDDETPMLEGMTMTVGYRPAVYWSWEFRRLQVDYLDGIDPEYFSYQVDLLAPELNGSNAQRAAVAIRTYYSQALETLFALLGSSVQSPLSPAPWMLHYKISDLCDLIDVIRQELSIRNRMSLPYLSWKSIAEKITPWQIGDSTAEHIDAMVLAMRRFANEFQDDQFQEEYNSIKHGLRVRPGGSFLAFGIQHTPGVPASADQMNVMYSYRFGSSFLKSESLSERKFQYAFFRAARNWDYENISERVKIICACIGNTLAYLKLRNGFDPASIPFYQLSVRQVDEAVDGAVSLGAFTMNRRIEAAWVDSLSREEILNSYPPPHSPDVALD
jgi:hypothetical protein